MTDNGWTRGLRFVAPTGVLGVGFPAGSFEAALDYEPDFIACDAGSADWGPYYLGSNMPWAGYHQTRRDLELMVLGARRLDIPLIIGTAGMSGSDAAVDWTVSIVEDIARDHSLDSFTLAKVYSELSIQTMVSALDAGRITAFEGIDELSSETVEASHRVVAMMGPEPIQEALRSGADVVIAGRASDAAVYAAFPLMNGYPPNISWHMGKIVECGAAIAPGTGECIVGEIHDDSFTVRTARDTDGCTASTVAVHMLYENPSPHILREPPGELHTEHAKYLELTTGDVEVSGATFEPRDYTVRLEGVNLDGYRAIALVGVRDPVIVDQIDHLCTEIERMVAALAPERFNLSEEEYSIRFRRYGLDAVLGEIEPNMAGGTAASPCYEIGLVTEAIAPSQELAVELLNGALPFIMHRAQVPGSSKGANAAFPYAPTVLETGPLFSWSLWHSLALDDPTEPFRTELVTISGAPA